MKSWVNAGHDVGLDVMAGRELFTHSRRHVDIRRHRDPRTGAFLGTTFVTPDAVKAKKAEVGALIDAINVSLQAQKSAIPPITMTGWTAFLQAWDAFYKLPASWLGAAGQMDQLEDFEQQANAWRSRLQLVLSSLQPAGMPAGIPAGPPAPPGYGYPSQTPPWGSPGLPNPFPGHGKKHGGGHKHEEESILPTWEESKPFVVVGGALVGLGIVASIIKSIRGT